MKKTLIVALVLLIGLAGNTWGVGQKETEGAKKTEQITFTYWLPFPPNASKLMRNASENLVNQELEKITGIHMEYIHPAWDKSQEVFNLMVASGDLPDIVQHMYTSYVGGGDKAIVDGIYLRLNELIDKFAPNFNRIRNRNETFKKQTITDAGNIWAFPMLELEEQPAYWGPAMREDWLKDLDLPIPTTLDEWETTLKAFKTEKGAYSPYLMDATGVGYSIVKAFGVDVVITQIDGRAIFGPVEDGFRQYLILANKWYSEGLIDKEFVNAVQNRDPYMAEGKIGAWEDGFWQFTIEENKNSDPNFKIIAVPPPSIKKGEEPRLRTKVFNNRGFEGCITTANEHPEEAAKWFDYLYSDEGTVLLNYGIEGISYTMENGKPKWTELMTNNPDGYDINELTNKYAWQNGPFLREWQSIMFTFSQAAQDANFKIWKGDTSYCMPMISLTPDEGTIYANIMSDINTYVSEMIIKFVNGTEPISNFDSFVKQVESMEIDKAVAVQQAALDRYRDR